jgi:murein DD-endopeptidase MepM/ murein hydrolase activator NlpD
MANITKDEVRNAFRLTRTQGKKGFDKQLEALLKEPATTEEIEALDLQFQAANQGSAFLKDRYDDVCYVDHEPRAEDLLPGNRLVRYADDDEHESDHPVAVTDMLIFIQGVEVSDYVMGSVQVEKNGIEGHNRVTFTLDNASDRFVWTVDNLRSLFEVTRPKEVNEVAELTSTSVPLNEALTRYKRLTESRFTHNEKEKRAIFDYKTGFQADGTPRNPRIRNAKNTPLFARYDLAPNRAIFSRMDPIRVFSLYPYRPRGQKNPESRELWMPEFAGFISNVSIEDVDLDGTSRIIIEAVDLTQAVLQRMRISSDPNAGIANPLDRLGFAPLSVTNLAGDIQNQTTANDEGNEFPLQLNVAGQQFSQSSSDFFFNPRDTLFYDDIVGSVFSQQFFPNMTMEEAVVELLVFKESNLISGAGNRGVRNVELGGTFHYDSTSKDRQEQRNYLENWHRFCLFGPKRRPWTRSEVYEVGLQTQTDGKFAPNNCRLWFLLPEEGTGPRNVADLSNVSAALAHDVNWTNRAEVLRNLIESIDYRMMVAPTGDLIVEFPMVDFRPEDFGEFKEAFRFNKGLIQSNFGDEQEDPVAGVIVTRGFAAGAEGPGNPVAAAALQTTFAFSPYIAARYGMTVEPPVQLPHLQFNDAAIAQMRAIIEFQKANARCNALSFGTVYRPFLLPNRPMHHIRRTRMGTSVTVSYEWQFGTEAHASTEVGLEHVRIWTGYYRSDDDFNALNELQTQELHDSGMTAEDAKGIDPTQAADELELQVYQTIMAGESTPTSARVGWGTGGEIKAPASGVYIVDPLKIAKIEEPSNTTSHEENKRDVPVTAPPEELPDGDADNHKFSHNPLRVMRATSPFGFRKLDGQIVKHNGLDLAAAEGTELFAVDDGVVTFSGTESKGGNVLRYTTNDGWRVTCIHLAADSLGVLTEGDEIVAGQLVGYTGQTGAARGPHLHIQIRNPAGTIVDPTPLFPGPVTGNTTSAIPPKTEAKK